MPKGRAPGGRPSGAPRKGVSPARRSPTCSCTARSISGCSGPIRASGSNGLRTMPSSTAGARRKPGRCSRPSGVALRSAAWSFIQQRPRSSTARMTTGRGSTSRSTRRPGARPDGPEKARRIACGIVAERGLALAAAKTRIVPPGWRTRSTRLASRASSSSRFTTDPPRAERLKGGDQQARRQGDRGDQQ